MTRARTCTTVGLFVALLATVGAAATAGFAQRQYYSQWKKHSTFNYFYRDYYYKPDPDYYGYKHHFVIFHPQKPKHLYFYNPYEKHYWGRCPVDHGGKPLYSMLAVKDRKGSLNDIPETAFPEPGKTPPIPDSKDGERLDLPPDDLPPGEPTAPGAK